MEVKLKYGFTLHDDVVQGDLYYIFGCGGDNVATEPSVAICGAGGVIRMIALKQFKDDLRANRLDHDEQGLFILGEMYRRDYLRYLGAE